MIDFETVNLFIIFILGFIVGTLFALVIINDNNDTGGSCCYG